VELRFFQPHADERFYQRVPFLWPLRQSLPQFGQILFPFCRFAALAPLRIEPSNGRVKRELRRFQVTAARGDVRRIPEQLHRVEIGPAARDVLCKPSDERSCCYGDYVDDVVSALQRAAGSKKAS
jgi:hypothetical protein